MGLAEVELVEDVHQHGKDVVAMVAASVCCLGGDPRILHLKMVITSSVDVMHVQSVFSTRSRCFVMDFKTICEGLPGQ